jgi:hypothetical protein
MGGETIMSNIKKVFLIIGALVLAFIVWGLIFNDGGILRTGYDAVQKPVNATWSKVTGDTTAKLLPEWSGTGVVNNDNLQNQNNSF